ncbi:MAG: cyclase [Halobacteriovoraceae bacterium]|nr:cyclase [Halobacteriovoraceae bacterium]|tara:strand:- start:9616 stop:10050 length:435 start_codon:yes stop_codon:yes gene_type:complete
MGASAKRSVTMDAPVENVYKVITDYESYADFMEGVSKVEVVERDGNKLVARYHINMIKKLTYTLNLVETENKEVSWSFNEGDLFSVNQGSWLLTDNGDGTTLVDYTVEVDLKKKMIGSGMIVKTLTEVQLPSMLKSVEERAKNV